MPGTLTGLKPPALVLSYEPPGPQFSISEQCEMPKIAVTASFQNIIPDPKIPLQFQWAVTLVFDGQDCDHSLFRVIRHSNINQTTAGNKFVIPFTEVRGGDLTVTVSVRLGNSTLTAKSEKLQVTGKNPSLQVLAQAAPPVQAFRKLMRLESGLQQFLGPACPYFSRDDKGGVGICQITKPAPTPDEVWSWKENLKAGWKIYREKEWAAKAYPKALRSSTEDVISFLRGADGKATKAQTMTFQDMVKAYNDQRAAKAKAAAAAAPGAKPPASSPSPPPQTPIPPLTVDLPDFTAEQLQRDTLRCYNGHAGGLHEYALKVDANGLLVVTEDPGGTKGTAQWELVSAADRKVYYDQIDLPTKDRGDLNYVNDVWAQPGF